MLERYLDVARLFRGYTWRDLPTRYLRSYTAPEKIKRADEAARRRTAGVPWGTAVPPPAPAAGGGITKGSPKCHQAAPSCTGAGP